MAATRATTAAARCRPTARDGLSPLGRRRGLVFWENQGAGIAVADLDGDGTPELVAMAVDNPAGQNGGYYSVGWRVEAGRPADGWGPWQPIPDWRFWENQDAGAPLSRASAREVCRIW